ncbi:MAG TPA: hypothetical protein VJU61_25300 [Polyangiaceae bacterium]|nr:hypothetical protein [Polyangiaceae bacterium]
MGVLVLLSTLSLVARAEEGRARQLFSEGLRAAARNDWLEAVRLLEASVEQADKPASRYNLVVASQELKRPLEVARHATAFLTMAERGAHTAEVAEVRADLDQALRELAVLLLQGLPAGVQLRVDDAPPRVADEAHVYVLPGLHRLELWLDERPLESIEIELRAGAVQAWPRVAKRAEPAVAAPEALLSDPGQPGPVLPGATSSAQAPHAPPASRPAPPPAWPLKRKLAWSLGMVGAAIGLGAIASYAYALRRADELESLDPASTGYIDVVDSYKRSARSVYSLALTGGVLMAGAAALAPHKPRGALAVSITTLVLGLTALGAGFAFVVRAPKELVEDSTIYRPTREAGALLLGASLPLMSYGIGVQWNFWQAN